MEEDYQSNDCAGLSVSTNKLLHFFSLVSDPYIQIQHVTTVVSFKFIKGNVFTLKLKSYRLLNNE